MIIIIYDDFTLYSIMYMIYGSMMGDLITYIYHMYVTIIVINCVLYTPVNNNRFASILCSYTSSSSTLHN